MSENRYIYKVHAENDESNNGMILELKPRITLDRDSALRMVAVLCRADHQRVIIERVDTWAND